MITSTRTIPLHRRIATGAAVVALASLVVACGDSDADPDAVSDPAVVAPVDGPVVVLEPAACAGWVDLQAALATAPQDPEAVAGFAAALDTITGSLAGELPEELAGDGEVLTEAAAVVAADGSPEALFAPEAMAAMTAIGGAAHEGCDLERVDLVGADYSFAGLEGSMPAGPASFELTNEGTEEHEMIVLRRNPGSDADLTELLDGDPEALFAEATMVGLVFAAPGEAAYTALELEPGEHLAVCTIPTGGEEGAEPHHAHGMFQAFTVT